MPVRSQAGSPDPADFIRANLRQAPAPLVPEILLYTAHSGSGLSRLGEGHAGEDALPPYWAYPWAGGIALARYLLDHPAQVAGARVMDLGAGSGIVAIAAAMAGASEVRAVDIDRHAVAATAINAAANGVTVASACGDPTGDPPAEADVIAVGDLFYDGALADRVLAYLDRCLDCGSAVLIGDPGRTWLPRGRLRQVAAYGTQRAPYAVFALERARS